MSRSVMFQRVVIVMSTIVFSANGYLHVGEAVNVFNHFGDLDSFLKVNPHQGPNWYHDQDSIEVFEEVFETRSPAQANPDTVFNGDFHLEFCDDLVQLKKAFFRGHNVEGCDWSWRGMMGGWTPATTARRLGLNTSYVKGAHGYVLVKLTHKHQLVRLEAQDGLRLNNWTAEHIESVVPGQVNSVLDFVRLCGSHFVSSYTTGDALYQVYVFSPSVYEELQKVMREYEADSLRLEQVLSFFSPWHTEHVGHILSASGNESLERWLSQSLKQRVFLFIYPSLLELHNKPELLHELNHLLQDNALLSVNLQTLAPLFTDTHQRLWFEEVLDNQLKLWELNV